MFVNKDAILFDLDGTLIDSLGIWNAVDVELIRTLNGPELPGQDLFDFREASLGRHRSTDNPYEAMCGDFGRLCGSALGAREIHAIRFGISRRMLRENVTLKAGADRVVKALHGMGKQLAICTTTKRANIEIYATTNTAISSRLAFYDYFPLILTKEDVAQIKPDPEVYTLALRRLGLLPQQCLVVEDTVAGVQAATQAGIETVVMADAWSGAQHSRLPRSALAYFPDYAAMLAVIEQEQSTGQAL